MYLHTDTEYYQTLASEGKTFSWSVGWINDEGRSSIFIPFGINHKGETIISDTEEIPFSDVIPDSVSWFDLLRDSNMSISFANRNKKDLSGYSIKLGQWSGNWKLRPKEVEDLFQKQMKQIRSNFEEALKAYIAKRVVKKFHEFLNKPIEVIFLSVKLQ